MKHLIFIIALALPLAAGAQEDPASGEADITIEHGEDRTVYEYRTNGQLYAIKVVPKKGNPYYLIDPEGDGNYIRVDKTRILIPSFPILEW